jgi:septal ring-binding cell division protein DamX/type II secretory pathway predicted ATPase ExeA
MALTPECLDRLGLQGDPFGPVPEETALYRDALLDGFADLALRALAEPSAVLVLAGAGGVGRSTQLQQVLSLLADDIELIAFRARPKVSFEAVDATLRFHLSELGSEDPRASLLHLFGERLRAGHVVLVAIDDAHLLATSVLEQLLGLRRQLLERLGAAARFLLVGDPGFAATPLPGLAAEEDTRVLRLHLRAFNREQTRGYLRHRLQRAGHREPEQLLKRELVERLHGSSNGLPKYLNALALDWLEERCDQQADEAMPLFAASASATMAEPAPSAPSPEEPPADAVVSAMTALEALRQASREASHHAEDTSAGRAANGKPARPSRAGQTKAKGRAPDGKAAGKAAGKAGVTPGKAQARDEGASTPVWNRPWFVPGIAVFSLFALLLPLIWQLPGSPPTEGKTQRGQNGLLADSQAPGTATGQGRRQAPVAPGVPLVSPIPTPVAEAGRADSSTLRREMAVPSILPGAPDDGDGRLDLRDPSAAADDADARLPAQSPLEIEPDAEPAAPGEAAANAEPPATAPEGLDRDWISRQSGGHFTIQLAAARSLAAARQHVLGYNGLEVRFVPIRSKSQDFVVVLAGAYAERAEAEAAAARLPGVLREQGYWIRTLDSVRQSLR